MTTPVVPVVTAEGAGEEVRVERLPFADALQRLPLEDVHEVERAAARLLQPPAAGHVKVVVVFNGGFSAPRRGIPLDGGVPI